MKLGRSLKDLAAEIHRQNETKKDYIAPTELMVMDRSGALSFGDDERRVELEETTDTAHTQIAAHTGIPMGYYNKMKTEAPDLLANNVNEWFKKYPAQRMVRTLDGRTRAFLSNSFRPLDNADLAEAVLPPLLELGVDILSCEVTESKLYIKAVDQRIERDIPTGKRMGEGHTIFDTVCPAITITNSEVGLGRLAILTSVFTRACTNLALFGEKHLRKNHAGARLDLGEDSLHELLSDHTKKLTDAAIWSQARDVVKASFDRARFDAAADRLNGLNEQKIEGDPVKVVELVAKKFTANDDERNSILKNLINGGDLTRYGLFNAITRTAEDLKSYDRATEFERLGGKIVELANDEWKQLAEAA